MTIKGVLDMNDFFRRDTHFPGSIQESGENHSIEEVWENEIEFHNPAFLIYLSRKTLADLCITGSKNHSKVAK